MRIYVCCFTLVMLLCVSYTSKSQNQLCLQKGSEQNTVIFDTSAINHLLQIKDYKIFLFGEMHNDRFTPEIKYQLITYLNQVNGIRHIIMEVGPARAWHYNRYLATGDTSLLHLHGSYLRFWQKLYAYNHILPQDEKLVIYGFDFNRTDIFPTLLQLLPAVQKIPEALRPAMDTIIAHQYDEPLQMLRYQGSKLIGSVKNTAFTHTARYIQRTLLKHKEETKALYGANYAIVNTIITNKSPVEVKPGRRNKTMFTAIKQLVKDDGIEKFMGIFGGTHIYDSRHALYKAVQHLPGIKKQDVLSIVEFIYNPKDEAGDSIITHLQDVKDMIQINGDCKASIVNAQAIQDYAGKINYLLIVNDAL